MVPASNKGKVLVLKSCTDNYFFASFGFSIRFFFLNKYIRILKKIEHFGIYTHLFKGVPKKLSMEILRVDSVKTWEN